MPGEKKQFVVQIPGEDHVAYWDEDKFNANQDKLYGKYPDAQVTEINTQSVNKPEDIDENATYAIAVPGEDHVAQWDGKRLAKNREALLAKYPGAQVARIDRYDYGEGIKNRGYRVQAQIDEVNRDINQKAAKARSGYNGDYERDLENAKRYYNGLVDSGAATPEMIEEAKRQYDSLLDYGLTSDQGAMALKDKRASLEKQLADLQGMGDTYQAALRQKFDEAVGSGEIPYEAPKWEGLKPGETEEQHRKRTEAELEDLKNNAPAQHDWAKEAAELNLTGEAFVEEMARRRKAAADEEKDYEERMLKAQFEHDSNPLVQLDKRIDLGRADVQRLGDILRAKRDAYPTAAFTPAGSIMNTREAALMSDKDYVRTQVAYTNALDRLHKDEMIRDHTVNSFWANAGNAVANPESWTFGLGKLYEAGVIMDAVKDQGAESSKEALEQTFLSQMTDAEYQEKQGNKGRWGQMTGEMAQFIIMNALGGGLYGGLGEAAKSKIVGEGASTLARKFLGAVASDAIVAGLTVNTVGAANTIAEILQRHNGYLAQNEDGTYSFQDGENLWKSIWNTETSQFTEYFTERLGEHFGVVGGKIASKVAGSKVGKRIGLDLGLEKVSKFVSREPVSGFEAGVRNFYKLSGIQGYPSEVMEEEIGIVMSNMLQWRNPVENVVGAWEGITDKEQQADIFGGMAFSIGLMQAVPLASHVGVKSYNNIHGARLNNNLNRADQEAHRTFDSESVWSALKDRINGATNEDITPIIYEIANDDSLRDEEKRAALNYVDGALRLRGFSTGVMSELQQATMARRDNEARDLLGTYGKFWTEDEVDFGADRKHTVDLMGTSMAISQDGKAKTEKGSTRKIQYARRLTFSDDAGVGFTEGFVLSEDEGKVMVKANDGKAYFVDKNALAQMAQDGKATDSGRVPMFMVLDQRATDMEKVREQQRMQQEAKRNAANLLNAATPGTQVNIGTEGAENTATVLGYQNGQFVVEDSEGKQQTMSAKDMAGHMGLPYDPKTDEQINEINGRADEKKRLFLGHQGKVFVIDGQKHVLNDASFTADQSGNLQATLNVDDGETISMTEQQADEILSQLDGDEANKYNDSIKPGSTVHVQMEGMEADYQFNRAVVEDGQLVFKATDLESGEEVDLLPEMVTNLDQLMGGTEVPRDVNGNPVPATPAITAEGQQTTNFFDDPVANALGISQDYVHVTPSGKKVVDRAKLWEDNPELWARWYDQQTDKTMSTRDYLENKLKKADEDVSNAMNEYAAEDQGEQNPDRLEALMEKVNEKTKRQQQIKSLFDKYDAAQQAAEKKAAAVEEQPVAETPVETPVEQPEGQPLAEAPAQPLNPVQEQALETLGEDPRRAVITVAQTKLDELAKRITPEMGEQERAAVNAEKAVVLQEMFDRNGATRTVATTMPGIVEQMRAAGSSEKALSEVQAAIEDCAQEGDVIEGFYDPSSDTIFMVSEGLRDAKHANRIHSHEAKHMENRRTRAHEAALSTGVTRDELKNAVHNYKRTSRYDGDSALTLADETLAIASEIAEEEGIDAVPQKLRELGVSNEEFIKFAQNNVDNGRRNGQHRNLAERDALQHTDEEVRGGQDGRDSGAGSGEVEGSGSRPVAGSAQGGRRGESAEPAVSQPGLSPDQEAVISQHELAKEGVASNEEESRFSVRYVPAEEKVDGIAEDISRLLGIPKEQSLRWVKSETSLAPIILDEHNSPFLNYEADGRYAAIKEDSDYPQGTVDFNNICRKRIAFTNVFQRLQRDFPNTVITGTDLAKIRQIMKDNGYTVACGLCYVEDRRQLLGEIARFFIEEMNSGFDGYIHGRTIDQPAGGKVNATKEKRANALKGLIGDDVKEDLNIYDLITLEGSDKLQKEHPGIYAAFQRFNAYRGQQAGNLFQGYAEYKREIQYWADETVAKVNSLGGLRIFSYSDFEAHHLIDLVQIIQDCAKRGVMIQGYTKVPAFARAVANTNIKLNRSLIPLGDTGIVDGQLAFDPVEGIDINDPDFIESNDNVGNVLVGINDEQIRLAMADPRIHYIIPYHSNQKGILRQMKQTGAWMNYKNEQTEKGEGVGKHGVNIYTDVLSAAEAEGRPITNEREFVEKFLQVCKERGWTPRFARFLNTNEAGEYVYAPGYYKLLLDFKMFDEAGNILPQKPVVAEFDDAFNQKILEDYVKDAQTDQNIVPDDVYEDIVDALDLHPSAETQKLTEAQKKALAFVNGAQAEEKEPATRFSIAGRDQEYLDAVQAGDMEKAQQMVDEAAEQAGYTIRGFHGTTHNFTIFDRGKGDAEGNWGKGFYFTNREDDADVNYGSEGGPDLQNKVERLAENMEWMDGYEDMDYDERRKAAEEMLVGDNPHVISATIRMENPLIIDRHYGANETYFDYNSGYNEETDEYDGEESGLLVDFVNAWNDVLYDFDYQNVSPAEILEYAGYDGLTASQLEDKAREVLDSIGGIMTPEGDYATGEFLRAVFERMGFDGIVDHNVNFKFGTQRKYGTSMDGMDNGTVHMIAFHPEQIKQADPVTYDNDGNIIPLSERFNPDNDDIRFSLRGILGAQNDDLATADLAVAEDMEAEGKSAKAIWAATGWERGKDGKWRNEIPDGKAKPIPMGKKVMTVGDLIDAPELFNSYPALKDYRVVIKKTSSAGSYSQERKDIVLDSDYNFSITVPEEKQEEAREYFREHFNNDPTHPATLRKEMEKKFGVRQLDATGISTMMHELQHAIQHIEGFARGGNKEAQQQVYLEQVYMTKPALVSFARVYSRKNPMSRLLRVGRERIIKLLGNAISSGAYSGEPQRRFEELRDYLAGIDDYAYRKFVEEASRLWKGSFSKGREMYEKLAGETESRNVEKRMGMSGTERLSTPPSETEDVAREEQLVRFSVVTDPAEIERLDSGEKELGYRTVTMNADGSFGSPKASKLGKKGEKSVKTSTFELGQWEQAEENPQLATEDGKINLADIGGVDYNPYIHIRPDAINKQFTSAWRHPEQVYIQTSYPTGELSSGYHADKAKLSVGRHAWTNGDLILSRWDKPERIVPWEEVADAWEQEFKDTGVTFDIVNPGLLPILAERGVEILPPKKAAGKPAMDAYESWKNGESPRFSVTAEQDKEYMDAVQAGREPQQRENDILFSIAYHGSKSDFTEFEEGHYREGTGSFHRPGFYFASDENSVRVYAYDRGNGAFIYEVELPDDNGTNYLDVFKSIPKSERRVLAEKISKTFPEKQIDVEKKIVNKQIAGEDLMGMFTNEELEKLGYVGIVGPMYIATMPQKQYIMFNPKDIKIKTKTNVSTGKSVRFSVANAHQEMFVSNAQRAVENIRQEKATPEQWLKMVEKNGGLKAGEDKWLGLSQWLKDSDKKSLTKQDILDYIEENKIKIEETRYGEEAEKEYDDALMSYQDEYAELVEEGEKMGRNVPSAYAMEEMVERYGERFLEAFERDGETIAPTRVWAGDDSLSSDAMYFLDLRKESAAKGINPTRLDYTTEGLENKREIALTVPTIDPWNQGDNIHFGDAGEGRAVAWIRFGDATKEGQRVLFIDEIQSKRHQEGREKGYRMSDKERDEIFGASRKAWRDYQTAQEQYNEYLQSVFGEAYDPATGSIQKEQFDIVSPSDEQMEHIAELGNSVKEAKKRWNEANGNAEAFAQGAGTIPAAPFEKNWQELAMKRMLRLAAEEGYDYVAWTKGEQQAERYNIGNVVSKISVFPDKEFGGRQVIIRTNTNDFIDLDVDDKGIVENGEYRGKPLSEVLGKDLASKIIADTENSVYEGDGLRIGGEGMKGFYDEMLPRFMNKYGKQWGVKVEDITLPGLENGNLSAHAVPVTQEMKDSVMEGQLMFSVSGQEQADRQGLIDAAETGGLKAVLGEENLQDFYREAYASIPQSALRPIVESGLANGGDIMSQLRIYLHDLARNGAENDETGLLFKLYDDIRFMTANPALTDNDIRWMIWKETADTRPGDLLSMAEDRAMRNRWGVGAEPAEQQFQQAAEETAKEAEARVETAKKELKEEKKATYGPVEAIAKAMAAQKTYDRATVDSIVKAAKDMLKAGNVSALNRREVSRLLTLVSTSAGKSQKSVTRYADQLVEMMLNHIVAEEEAKFMKLVKVKASKVSDSGVEVQGKLDLVGQAIIKAFRDNMNSPVEDIRKRLEEVDERIDSKDDAVREEAVAAYYGLKMALQYKENIAENIEEYKDLKEEFDAAGVKLADVIGRKAYDEFVKQSRDALRKNMMERIDMYRDLGKQLTDVIAGSAEAAAAFRKADQARVEEIHHDANRDMQGTPANEHLRENVWQRFLNSDFVRFFFKSLSTADQMFRLLGRKSVTGEGYLFNRYIKNGFIPASEKASKGIFAATEILDKKVSEVFGKKGMKWSDLYAESRKKGGEVTFLDGGEMKSHEVSVGNLLYIYMANKMADGKMKLRRMGIGEEDVERIKESIDPRLIELADWMQNEFYVNLRNKYNEVHERMFGAPMAAIEDYVPLKILANARFEDVDLGAQTQSEMSSTITGSIIKRRRNSLALDILHTDAFSLAIEHIEKMEDWAAFAELRRDLNTLLSYKHFRNQVKNMDTVYGSGDVLWENFAEVCQVLAGKFQPKVRKGSIDTIALNAAKGVTAAKISFRVNTAIKQILSFPAYLSDARVDFLAKSVATPGKSWKWCMENLPLFEKRWKSRIAGDTRLLDTDSDWKIWRDNVVKTASRLGMTPNAFVDATTVAIGAKAMYDTKRARYIKDGYSEEEADQMAKKDAEILYNQTQQSSENAFVSPVQLERTWWSVALTTYRNSSMAYQRQLHDAIRTMAKMLKPGYRQRSIDFMTHQNENNGLEEEEAREAATRQYNRQYFRNLVRVAVFGYGLQFLWKIGNDMWYLLFGDDDDEKDKILKEAALAELAGPVEGLVGGNVISDIRGKRVEKATNEEYGIRTSSFGQSSGLAKLPIESDTENILNRWDNDRPRAVNDIIDLVVQAGVGVNPQTLTDAVVAIIDYADGDLDKSKEMALLMMRILQMPQSTVEKFLVDEIDMEDPDKRKEQTDELAKRYAMYKLLKNTTVANKMYDEGKRDKKLESYEKQFKDAVKKRIAIKETASGEEIPETAEDTYKALEKAMKAFQTDLNRAKKDDDTVTQQNLEASPEYQQYLIWKKHQKGINKLNTSIKKTQDDNLRQQWEDQLKDSIQVVINELNEIK